MIEMTTKVSELSVGELLACIDEHLAGKDRPSKKIRGIKGLAEYLQCSERTAMRMKVSGRLDGTYIQSGRVITFDENKLKYRLRTQ